MERIEYECETCGETHERDFVTELPAHGFTEVEVQGLDATEEFNTVLGYDFGASDSRPEEDAVTEKILIERDEELVLLQLVEGVGWAVDMRREIDDTGDRDESVLEAMREMQEATPEGPDHLS